MFYAMFLKLCAASLILWLGTVKGAKPVVRSMSIDSTGKIKDNQNAKSVVRSMRQKSGSKPVDDRLSMSIESTGKVNERVTGRSVIRKVHGTKNTNANADVALTRDTSSCYVTVYEHWPENIAAGISGLEAAESAWGGHFPTGASMVLQGVGDHPLGALSNLTSSVKVEGPCCKAYGYASSSCADSSQGSPIETTTQLIEGLPAGVVTPATGLASLWSCNDCTQCVKVVQECTFGLYAHGIINDLRGEQGKKVSINVATDATHVILAGPPTFNGNSSTHTDDGYVNPAMTRMEKTTTSTISAWISETNCHDKNTNITEVAGYAILKEGGSAESGYIVGTVTVYDSNTTTVDLGVDLGSSPFIFAFSQSGSSTMISSVQDNVQYKTNSSADLDENYVAIRIKSVTNDSFQIQLQPDEETKNANNEPVFSENIAYLAVKSGLTGDYATHCSDQGDNPASCVSSHGTLNVGGQLVKYEMGLVYSINTIATNSSDNGVVWTSITYRNTTFTSAPVVFAEMQTRNGGNPASIRIKKDSSTTTGFSFIVDEENCNDEERKHVSEWVAYLAIEAPTR